MNSDIFDRFRCLKSSAVLSTRVPKSDRCAVEILGFRDVMSRLCPAF